MNTHLCVIVGVSLSFVQFTDHDVVTELEGQVPVSRLSHLGHQGLPQGDSDLGE